MSLSSAFVTRFFQLVSKRQFAEAERVLERLELKTRKNERNRGYLQALYGIFMASKSNKDQYLFLSNANLKDKNELEKHRREFSRYTRDNLHAEYDHGFFSAWAKYMHVLLKLIESEERSVQNATKQTTGARSRQMVAKKPKKIVQARLV